MSFIGNVDADLKKFWSGMNNSGFKSNAGHLDTSGRKISPPDSGPFARSYDEIISIQQKGAKGFQTFDIDPYLLDRPNFFPTIDAATLESLAGPEGNYQSNGFISGESDILPYWRSVRIDAAATWVKIEYLPTTLNEYGTAPYASGALPDETIYPGAKSDSSQNYLFSFAIDKIMSQKIILVQFDDNRAPPLIAKHGDVFKVPFNSIYITIKQWSPKIRVTVGYNTEIVAVDDRETNMNLAMGPGHGIFTNPTIHAVPFSLSVDDTIASPFSVVATSQAMTTVNEIMIANPYDSTSNKNGLSVGWITNFSGSAYLPTASTSGFGSMGLFIATYLTTTNAGFTTPALTKIRRLASPSYFLNRTSSNDGKAEFNLSFETPIRFTLHSNECLLVRIYGRPNDNVSTIQSTFSVTGYHYGSLVSKNVGALVPFGPFTSPFVPAYKLTQESYPQDREYVGSPNT